jgi:hypothetical protein
MSTNRTKAKSARKTSGKVKTARAAQKRTTGQQGAKAEASGNDIPTVDMLWEEVARGYTGPRRSPDPADADNEEAKAAEMGWPESVEESEQRRAIFKRRRADEPEALGDAETNVISHRLQEDVEGLLSLAIRLRTAAEARAHVPVSPDYEDPNVFAKTVAALVPQLVRATHLLVEFINLDCDLGGLAAPEIDAVRRRSMSWPDFYHWLASDQSKQVAKYAPKNGLIGADLPFYVHQSKNPGHYMHAALDTLGFVYANLTRFAVQPPNTTGRRENPLRWWVRTNQLIELCDFVATMRFAPAKSRAQAVEKLRKQCDNFDCPAWIAPDSTWQEEFKTEGWGNAKAEILKKIKKYQEDRGGASVRMRHVDFAAWDENVARALESTDPLLLRCKRLVRMRPVNRALDSATRKMWESKHGEIAATAEYEWEHLEAYYSAKIPPRPDHRCRDLSSLFARWSDQVSRAGEWSNRV